MGDFNHQFVRAHTLNVRFEENKYKIVHDLFIYFIHNKKLINAGNEEIVHDLYHQIL